jgi:hypothetical protein
MSISSRIVVEVIVVEVVIDIVKDIVILLYIYCHICCCCCCWWWSWWCCWYCCWCCCYYYWLINTIWYTTSHWCETKTSSNKLLNLCSSYLSSYSSFVVCMLSYLSSTSYSSYPVPPSRLLLLLLLSPRMDELLLIYFSSSSYCYYSLSNVELLLFVVEPYLIVVSLSLFR